MTSLLFNFEELPLLIDLGTEGGLVNGSAEIGYIVSNGDWYIRKIYLDGYKPVKNGCVFERKSVEVEQGPLYNIIVGRLYGEWHDRVQEAVNQQIAGDCSIAHVFDHRHDSLKHARAL